MSYAGVLMRLQCGNGSRLIEGEWKRQYDTLACIITFFSMLHGARNPDATEGSRVIRSPRTIFISRDT